jgi:hypothetical protein
MGSFVTKGKRRNTGDIQSNVLRDNYFVKNRDLGLTDPDIQSLFERGLSRPGPQRARPKERVDYEALRQTYAEMPQEGRFANASELACHLGKSRVWVILVTNESAKPPSATCTSHCISSQKRD